MLPVTYIKSVENFGCGIASAAMLAGVSYDRMRKAIFPKLSNARFYSYYDTNMRYVTHSLGTSTDDEIAGLERLGCKVMLTNTPEKYFNKHRVSIPMFWWNDYRPDEIAHMFVWDPIKCRFFDPSYDRPLHNSVYKQGFERIKKHMSAIVLLKGQLA
jgi:hypothetical protein